jgi:hypothetical protein
MMVSVRLVSLAACGAFALTLLAPSSAFAHISVTPGLLVVDETQTLRLSVHNDLDQPMTGLAVSAPTGLQIVDAGADDAEQWQDVVEDQAVTWSGGPLAPNTGAAFTLDVALDESTPPGPLQLQAEQLYPGDGKLPWPIFVTVVPEDEESQALIWAIVGGIVLLATGGITFIALRRRGRTLQER